MKTLRCFFIGNWCCKTVDLLGFLLGGYETIDIPFYRKANKTLNEIRFNVFLSEVFFKCSFFIALFHSVSNELQNEHWVSDITLSKVITRNQSYISFINSLKFLHFICFASCVWRRSSYFFKKIEFHVQFLEFFCWKIKIKPTKCQHQVRGKGYRPISIW